MIKRKVKYIRKQSKASLPRLKRHAWRVFADYIKNRDGNTCISCGKTGLVGQNWSAGHYIKAELCNLIYRYDERNVNSQCGRCNKWLAGNSPAYRNAMLDKYGVKAVKEIDAHYKDPLPLDFNTRGFYEQIIEEYSVPLGITSAWKTDDKKHS